MNDLGNYLLKQQQQQQLGTKLNLTTRKILMNTINENKKHEKNIMIANKTIYILKKQAEKAQQEAKALAQQVAKAQQDAKAQHEAKAPAEKEAKAQQDAKAQAEKDAKAHSEKEAKALAEQEAKAQEALIMKRKFVFTNNKKLAPAPEPVVEIKPKTRPTDEKRKFVFTKK